MKLLPVSVVVLSLAFFGSRAAMADSVWNLDFEGTDGYGDTLSITGTLTTAPGTGPLAIDAIDLSFVEDGVPGASNIVITDSSTTLDPGYGGADELLYIPGPYFDSDGLSFTLASGTGGGDFLGDVNLFGAYDGSEYIVPSFDEPPFTGTVTVTPASAPPTVTPEPSSLALLATGILGAAGVVRRRLV